MECEQAQISRLKNEHQFQVENLNDIILKKDREYNGMVEQGNAYIQDLKTKLESQAKQVSLIHHFLLSLI